MGGLFATGEKRNEASKAREKGEPMKKVVRGLESQALFSKKSRKDIRVRSGKKKC